jgi:ABC-2 type transport system permease protein
VSRFLTTFSVWGFQGVIVLCLAGLVHVPYAPSLIIGVFAIQLLLAFTITTFGVMVAARVSQMQSFMALMQMAIMPMFFLSGALFPVTGLPRWLEILNRIDPLTYAVDPIRRIVFSHLEVSGAARRALAPGVTWWGWHVPSIVEVGVLGLLGLIMLAAAIVQFSRAE